jgi:hypothetical protein
MVNGESIVSKVGSSRKILAPRIVDRLSKLDEKQVDSIKRTSDNRMIYLSYLWEIHEENTVNVVDILKTVDFISQCGIDRHNCY